MIAVVCCSFPYLFVSGFRAVDQAGLATNQLFNAG